MADVVESQNSPENLAGQDYHIKAEQLRESGDFLGAVKSAAQAFEAYLSEGNIPKASEAKSSEMLSHRHLFETTGDETHLDNARTAIEKSVSILKENDEEKGLGTALYNLAKFYQTEGNRELAIDNMKVALRAFEDSPEDPMGFPAHIAEIRTRLAAMEYGQGDDEAHDRFEAALEDLKRNPPDEYAQRVWLSGAYMHMAQACITRGEKDKALEQFKLAEEIIKGDEQLKLRQNQLEKLRESF